MVDYTHLVGEFNSKVAGLPEEEARNNLFEISEQYRLDHKTKAVKKLFKNLKYVRNEHAELIAGGVNRFVPYPEIIEMIMPKDLSREKQREFRFNKLQRIFQSSNLSDNQKKLLFVRGVPYKASGEVDLQEFAYHNISFEVSNFSIFEGKLDRRSDRRGANKELNQHGIERPEETNFHHQITLRNKNHLILIDNGAHDVPHIGFKKFARIEICQEQDDLQSELF
jgi:hypothetical protein